MKKVLILLSYVLTTISSVHAQNCITNYLGTKTLYKYHAQKYTHAPAGYLPVFINHVGRHGARHLTKDVKSTYAYKLLFQADSAGVLTAKGKQLKQMVIALQKVEHGYTKYISAEGKNELYGIGERMSLNYAYVFKGKANFDVAVTKEVRTTQSAQAFLSGFNSKLKDTANVNFYNDDTDLRFYDLSPAYKQFQDGVSNSGLILSLKKADDFTELVNTVTDQFFSKDFLSKIDKDKKEQFANDIFGFTTILCSLDAEVKQAGFEQSQLNFNQFFTCDQLIKLGRIDSAIENLEKGPGDNNDGIQVRVAVPLLLDFINSTDEHIKTGKYNARLRFAHAETIAPFAALLHLSTTDKAGKNIKEIQANWHSQDIIPLSSNIQWVFYKKQGKAGYLVKVLLNEKETRIDGLMTNTFPYYNWNTMREFYVHKLKKLHVGLSDPMETYLQQLK